jgi:uncharacterized protein (TIGR02301 family)
VPSRGGTKRCGIAIALAVCASLNAGLVVRAADGPFEPGLMRLSEVLGSLAFLRRLCDSDGDSWRGEMERLLVTEKAEEARRARLVASFNRGYRSFEASYATCTHAAREAIRRYLDEGERLARDIATRYGN